MSFPLCSNERVKNSLSKLISNRRLPHAIIIEGISGTGKRTLADYIAKAALCEQADSPCGVCRSCHLAAVKTHPDIKRIAPEDKKKNIAVSQIDGLREFAYLTPHTSNGKVFIIEQSETMNAASQNKLLKLLEEPPSNVIFILLCETSAALLNTVVSRCTVFSLSEPDFSSALEELRDRGFSVDEISESLKINKNNIGKTLEAIGSAKTSLGVAAAEEFLMYIEQNDRLNALLSLNKLDKNRQQVNLLIKELKFRLIEKTKNAKQLPASRLEYTKMYDSLCEMEPLLITNVNLSLFFAAMVSRLISIKSN